MTTYHIGQRVHIFPRGGPVPGVVAKVKDDTVTIQVEGQGRKLDGEWKVRVGVGVRPPEPIRGAEDAIFMDRRLAAVLLDVEGGGMDEREIQNELESLIGLDGTRWGIVAGLKAGLLQNEGKSLNPRDGKVWTTAEGKKVLRGLRHYKESEFAFSIPNHYAIVEVE